MRGARCKQLRIGSKADNRAARREYLAMRQAKAQNPKAAAERHRSNLDSGKAPQPRSSSGWKRTGPLVVVKPHRRTEAKPRDAFVFGMAGRTRLSATEHRVVYGMMPKWMVDRMALQHPRREA